MYDTAIVRHCDVIELDTAPTERIETHAIATCCCVCAIGCIDVPCPRLACPILPDASLHVIASHAHANPVEYRVNLANIRARQLRESVAHELRKEQVA